jgi:hypothetical protein
MKIGLITTINTNIGDDLIREGICILLKKLLKGKEIKFIPINKHRPATVYPIWHPIRWTDILPKGRILAGRIVGKMLHRFGYSYFDNCDLIVQCGAPVLWHGCYRAEWADILWDQIIKRLYHRIPVLNLAAGSSYPWEQQPTSIEELEPKDTEYLRQILGYCRITTVRDALAQKLCLSLGFNAPLIPCSAFLASWNKQVKFHDNIIIINYMKGGGHYDWGQRINPIVWFETIKTLVNRLKKGYRLVFLCHSEVEYQLASQIDSTIPRVWPKTIKEYFNAIPPAKAAICNRLHASIALAGMGIPSIAVGTDTRMLMVKAIGLPIAYVKNASVEFLEDMLDFLLKNYMYEKERLINLKYETFKRYTEVISNLL